MRGLAISAAMALVVSGVGAAAPVALVRTSDLNGKRLALPADLPVERTILLLAFRHEDRGLLEGWRKGLKLTDERADWIEMPVIGVSNPYIQSMIRGGMRGKRRTQAGRAHVAPVFSDAALVAATFGVAPDAVRVLVIDRSGRVLASAGGSYTAQKAQALSSALSSALR